ncbi:MAG TPA: sigma-70 family RNA polymerase sigma factor [Terriglobia bacterium]|nr:sigma-70 family RNA polymerase sigma factor [Terriglobia bacterium]
MKQVSPPQVTQLLQAWSNGDRAALEKLAPIVFAELKRLARRQMAHERPDHSLESGALVNEAYLRLVGWPNARWQNRAHFFGMCARMMRQILVDHARARKYQKRNAGQKVWFEDVVFVSDSKSAELLELDDALKRLAQLHRRKSDVVELRFFGGLSFEETAEVLNVSRLTVIRDWNFARAWLRSQLRGKAANNAVTLEKK